MSHSTFVAIKIYYSDVKSILGFSALEFDFESKIGSNLGIRKTQVLNRLKIKYIYKEWHSTPYKSIL